MTDIPTSGKLSVTLGARTYRGDWRVEGQRVEVSCELGQHSAPLGLLKSAPGTVAREALIELVKRTTRPPAADQKRRYDLRGVV